MTAVSYVRRMRMELEFSRQPLPAPTLPEGYRWVPWTYATLERHAAAKYLSFCQELDALLFASFRSYSSCRRLMRCIARQERFAPATTWLIARVPFDRWSTNLDCATIQGLTKSRYLGSIQNVGVVPEHRGFGLGRAIVLKSLHGFRSLGMQRVALNVTAANDTAIALYQSLGFRVKRTFYHPVSDEWSDPLACLDSTSPEASASSAEISEPNQRMDDAKSLTESLGS